MEGIAIITC